MVVVVSNWGDCQNLKNHKGIKMTELITTDIIKYIGIFVITTMFVLFLIKTNIESKKF